jgi:hypothetical protein
MLRSVFRDTDPTRWQKACAAGWYLQRGCATLEGYKSSTTATYLMCPTHFACFQDYAKATFCHTMVQDAEGPHAPEGQWVMVRAPTFFWDDTVLAVGHTSLRQARDFAISREWKRQHEEVEAEERSANLRLLQLEKESANLQLLLLEAMQLEKGLVQAQEDFGDDHTSDFTHLHQRDQDDIIQEYLDADDREGQDDDDTVPPSSEAGGYSKPEIYLHEVEAFEEYLERAVSDGDYVDNQGLEDREDREDREADSSKSPQPSQQTPQPLETSSSPNGDAENDRQGPSVPEDGDWLTINDHEVPIVTFRKPRMVVPLRHKRSKLLYKYPVKPKRPEQRPLSQVATPSDSEQPSSPTRVTRRTDLRIVVV